MIGNDVIDLGDPETQPGATHARFDERVFDATELAMIRSAMEPNSARWLLWAAKESAFKALRQLDSRLTFSPSRFAVRMDPTDPRATRGTVECQLEARVGFCAVQAARSVHVIARTEMTGDGALVSAMARIDRRHPSVAVRELATAALAPCLGVDVAELAIVRERRIPRLLLRGEPAPVALSLSHHGQFVAFAAVLASSSLARGER